MSGIAIGLDLGTSGLRAALVDEAGECVAFAAAPIEAAARRRPESWWDATRQALAVLRDKAALSGVRAIAIDGTSGTVLPVDAAGRPLAEASLYSDRADTATVAAVEEVAAEDSAAIGATSPLARMLAWRDLPRFARGLHEADWLTGVLRGAFDTTDANNALKTGFDPRVDAWPDWVLNIMDGRLPRVTQAGTALGRLLPDIADELGLPRETVVMSGTTDGCAAFLATGATETGDAVTSLGSTVTLKLLSDRPVFAPKHGIYSHLVHGRWLAGGASNSGGGALRRHFDTEALARLSERIDGATDSPLDYYPLPAPGERFPLADPTLAPRETPRPEDDAAFLHGMLQGISRIEALGYWRLAELGASPARTVRTVGGGARNPAWTAIRARLLGVPMKTPRSEEAAVGTARLALSA